MDFDADADVRKLKSKVVIGRKGTRMPDIVEFSMGTVPH
jgi:hypothetical protein